MNFWEDLTITSLDEIRVFDLDGNYLFTMDELQDATISNTEDKVDITGKAGRKLSTIKRNKAVTVSGTNGMLSIGLMGVQTGTGVTVADGEGTAAGTVAYHYVDYTEVLPVSNATNKATIKYTPKGSAVNDVYITNDDGILTKRLALVDGGTPTTGKYTYSNKEITLADADVTDNTKIAVFYDRSVVGTKITNTSDIATGKYDMYIDATAENKCGDEYHAQFNIPKADFSGNFDIALGGDQVVHAFEAEALAGSCKGAGEFWSVIVFGEKDNAEA